MKELEKSALRGEQSNPDWQSNVNFLLVKSGQMKLQTSLRHLALFAIIGLVGGCNVDATDSDSHILRPAQLVHSPRKKDDLAFHHPATDVTAPRFLTSQKLLSLTMNGGQQEWQHKTPAPTKAIINHLLDDQEQQYTEKNLSAQNVAKAQSQFAEQEGRIAFLEQQKEIDAIKLQRQGLIGVLLSLVAALGLITFVLLSRHILAQRQIIKILCDRDRRVTTRARETERLLKQKTLLIHEINHRVKNNLQTIISLLNTQRRCLRPATTDAPSDILSDVRSRVETMAIVQQSLTDLEKVSTLKALPFVSVLISRLIISSGQNIDVSLDVEDIELSVDDAAPLALIINELVCNALKHAFKDGAVGQLQIGLKPAEIGKYRLTCQDNGAGVPQDFNLKALDSFGLSIAKSLAEQIHGELKYEDTIHGSRWVVLFAADKNAHRDKYIGRCFAPYH